MKAFTLDLSKEAMLILQLQLPKGYSLVRTTKEVKKESKTKIHSNISADSVNHDLPSDEFDPTKSPAKTKKQKNQPAKSRGEPKVKIAKQQSITQTSKMHNEQITLKNSNKDLNNSKKEPQIFDSDSQEDTTSEPKSNLKTKIKEQKVRDKTQSEDQTKGKKKTEKSAQTYSKVKKNKKQRIKENFEQQESKEIIPKAKKIQINLKEEKQDNQNEKKTPEKESVQDESQKNLLKGKQDIEKVQQKKKGKKSKPKTKKYSYEDRLGIISRIRKFDKQTMTQFFKAISFSKGETLDFKLMEDENIKSIEQKLIQFEEIYNEKMRLEREKLKSKNPKSLDDFEVAEDKDYYD